MRTTIDSYKTRTGRLDTTDIDFNTFMDHPLSPEGLRCLRYMHDIEHHTVCYLRDLLLTPAHRDPDVTAFLSCWSFEELWHGEAIGAVLAAHGEEAGTPRIARLRSRHPKRDFAALLAKFGLAAGAGDAFVTLHMTWGAVNEWTTQAGYARLASLEGHPVLTELLKRIMKQEGRHIDFYATEAARRLAESRPSRRLTRLALRRLWRPVGSGVMPRSEVAFLVRHLFGDEDGMAVAARIDRRIDALPGQEGLALLTRTVARDR
ncbi:MAG: ferritin-like domain-containing protein [Acidimicrobiales bacterium]